MTVTLTLPYPISANDYWGTRVVHPKGRRAMALVYTTHEAAAYKRDVQLLAKAAGLRAPIDGRVRVGIRLYAQRPQDWARRCAKDPDHWDDKVRRLDLDNARKVLYDALKGVAFGDDKWIWSDWGDVCEPDERGARVEVVIEPVVREAIAPGLFHVESNTSPDTSRARTFAPPF